MHVDAFNRRLHHTLGNIQIFLTIVMKSTISTAGDGVRKY